MRGQDSVHQIALARSWNFASDLVSRFPSVCVHFSFRFSVFPQIAAIRGRAILIYCRDLVCRVGEIEALPDLDCRVNERSTVSFKYDVMALGKFEEVFKSWSKLRILNID